MKRLPLVLLVATVLLVMFSGCRLRNSDAPAQQGGQIVPKSELANAGGYEELRRQLTLTRDSLIIANSMLETLDARMYTNNDSLLRRYALSLWLDGRSSDAISMLSVVDGRTQVSRFSDRRGSLLLTFTMLSAVVLGFLYVCLRLFRSMSDVQSERPFNKGIAALAGLLIYYVFSVAGISLPVLILNSLAVKPIYSIILNFLSLMLGATTTLFVGKMLASDGERTVLAGIILGIFTTVFFIDMLFKALFYAFETTVLLPNTMFVLGVVLVYLFAREPKPSKSSYQFTEQRFNS
ncbi:MAG: hypothetical protein AB8G77_16900 [Rhodothermales bacterium]